MRPLRLYLKDFMCHDKSFIDFTQFNCALIVGKVDNNEMQANGVGKTTIFKAIEYVLFNQSNIILDRIIRDDTTFCQVVFDFAIDDQEYRLLRSRTKKGSTDLSLFQRNNQEGSIEEVYHSINEDPWLDKKQVDKYWKDLSGSRASDTEKDLGKLLKINHKSFCSTVLFPQNDLTGLPTVTPEKRKGILKEAFNLSIYSKLEKIAKDRSSLLLKEIEKNNILLENLGDPEKDISSSKQQLILSDNELSDKSAKLDDLNIEINTYNQKIIELSTIHSNLESKCATLITQNNSLTADKNRLETSLKEYQSRKSNVSKSANELISEIKSLKEEQIKLAEINYSEIEILDEQISSLKEKVGHFNIIIKNSLEKYEELKIPLPSGSICNNCRKPMTDKDREDHKKHISDDMIVQQNNIKQSKQEINSLNSIILSNQQKINSLKLSKQQLENINTKITVKNKDVQDKKNLYEEYSNLWKKFDVELSDKNTELNFVKEELKSSSLEEANIIKSQIDDIKNKIALLTSKINILNKEISHFNSSKAVILHTISHKEKDLLKKNALVKSIKDVESKLNTFPSVLQALSTTGIPNLIIQNVLDDLQVEANILLTQINPALQLSFLIEKTVEKTGDQADTLDISYTKGGKDRYFQQLSGAEQLAVIFSLKLGLSFVLQKMFGSDIKMILLDEIDQSLDAVTVNAFADLVKFFSKDFTILIITHNDRLKDKFSHAILVEQDINMISRAKVVSSW